MSNNRIWIIMFLAFLLAMIPAVVVTAASANQDIVLQVTPSGQTDVVLECGEPYEETGASAVASAAGQFQDVAVDTQGTVDTKTVGTYWIRYVAHYHNQTGTAYRRIRVVDTQAPVITFDSQVECIPSGEQITQGKGYTAQDNCDGDLTESVLRTVSGQTATYTVTDTSGNQAVATRPIVFEDTVAPTIQLLGQSSIIINVGSEYLEPGYTATDDCDGDVTGGVSIQGSVDSATPGRYTLTYTVQDGASNVATITRGVFVKSPQVSKVNDPANVQKPVYLTFDDGPGPYTERLLDILEKYNVQATFFVVNTGMIGKVARMAQEGHTVAIHTASHKFRQIYASEDAFFEDLYQMQEIIFQHTGQTATLMRFPGGSSNTISRFNRGIMTRLAAQVEEKGFTYFDWNVDSNDAGGTDSAYVVSHNVINGISAREVPVVLMHDIKNYTVDAIEDIILWGLNNGCTFLPLDTTSPTCHHTINN